MPTDDQQGAVGAAFASQLGARKVYVLHDGSIYGQGISAVFASSARQLGLEVAGGPEGMDPSAADYHDLAERVRRANPDLVYFGGQAANHSGKLWQDLRAACGPDVQLMGGDGINDNAFIDAAGSAAEGTYATFPGLPAPKLTGNGATWYQRYVQEFGETPQPYVAYGYEAMSVALANIARVGTKARAAVRDAIFATATTMVCSDRGPLLRPRIPRSRR